MNPLIVLLHMPKTGGTTLHLLLEKVYGERYLRIPNLGHYDASFEWDLGWINFDQLDCISGHIPYGIHRMITNREVQYVTFLRDPLDRLLSYYGYVRSRKANLLHAWMIKQSVKDFLMGNAIGVQDNDYTRMLAGRRDIHGHRQAGPVTVEDYEMAKDHLDDMYFVGTTDTLDHDIMRLADLLGWDKTPSYSNELVNPDRPIRSELTSKMILRVRLKQMFDYDLYFQAARLCNFQLMRSLVDDKING